MKHEETLFGVTGWVGQRSAPSDGRNTAGKLRVFVFQQITEDRASDKMQFFKQDQNDAKLKTIRQLKWFRVYIQHILLQTLWYVTYVARVHLCKLPTCQWR